MTETTISTNTGSRLQKNTWSRVDETKLWQRRDEEPGAREELVARFQAFARNVAYRYHQGPGTPEDLIQVAMVGLLYAIDRYDYKAGFPFLSFASPTVTGEVKRYFRDRSSLIRLPRNLQEEIYAVDEATSELAAELKRSPTAAEIEARADLEAGGAARATQGKNNRTPKSLDCAPQEDGLNESEKIGFEDPHLQQLGSNDELETAMEELGGTERLVLALRFSDDMTQSEIADRLGCSQMHVSRLIRKSLAKVQTGLTDES